MKPRHAVAQVLWHTARLFAGRMAALARLSSADLRQRAQQQVDQQLDQQKARAAAAAEATARKVSALERVKSGLDSSGVELSSSDEDLEHESGAGSAGILGGSLDHGRHSQRGMRSHWGPDCPHLLCPAAGIASALIL